MAVFVLGKGKLPLMPCSEKRARKLLEANRAVVVRVYPFTIRLKDRSDGIMQPLNVKLDPGSKVTGIALTRDVETVTIDGEIVKTVNVLNLFELTHRGELISSSLKTRKAFRASRRARNTRYRSPRFLNRARPKGWLPPSLNHRVTSILNLVIKLKKLVPLTNITQELVKFDMQKMVNPEISGIEYQQGTLQGYEVREYLLEKYNRTCVYCGVKNVPLQIEHIQAKSKGGTNRISNLTLACECCNKKKDNLDISVFLKNKPELLNNILKQVKSPLKDAAAVNATRWSLFNNLKKIGLSMEVGSGGLTKFNRVNLGLPKTHVLDAVSVGKLNVINNWNIPSLIMKSTGRGRYSRTYNNSFGFPIGYLMKTKSIKGFQTGDTVKALITKGKKIGEYFGRLTIKATGYFTIKTRSTTVNSLSFKYFTLIQRADGYSYTF